MICRKCFGFLSKRLFLPQLYKIGILITQPAIYTQSPKIPLITRGPVLPQLKKLNNPNFFVLNLKAKILKISWSKTIEIESEMMGGGNMGYESRASSSSSKFNGVVRVLECWCLEFVLLENPILQKTEDSHFMFALC